MSTGPIALEDVAHRATVIARSRLVPGLRVRTMVDDIVRRYAAECARAAGPDHLNDWLIRQIRHAPAARR